MSKMVNVARNNANLGKPWAQYHLGRGLLSRSEAVESMKREAMKWLKMAAAHGHPGACVTLSHRYFYGEEYGRDLAKAEAYAEQAKEIHSAFVPVANKYLYLIASTHLKYSDDAAAEHILSRLIFYERDSSSMDIMGGLLSHIGAYHLAALAFERCAMAGSESAANFAASLHLQSEKYSLAKGWSQYARKANIVFGTDSSEWLMGKDRRDSWRCKLREIRDFVGWCDVALEGETRKMCGGCRTYCYCSRDCQKRHWNDFWVSHSEECKEAGKRVVELRALLDKTKRSQSA
eukprot:CAMPEP_0181065338 /NCGR_PEP_ID=MMETSP1070-20121207/24686_1 /TAXON_ID=265543 /ORGANISM="Minutocellus polymorphus, Strain NH13" /LENGTH=289 /DNA_ID=CAMNT_0023145723 /DNA_START=136 /DNA_END=1005 /DNA_ORIENTATION=+